MRGYVSRLSIVAVFCTIMISQHVFAGEGPTLAELSLQVNRLNEQAQQSRNSLWFRWGWIGLKVATLGAIAYQVLNHPNGPWSQRDLEASRRRVSQHGKEIDQRTLEAHRIELASMAVEHAGRMNGQTEVVEKLGGQIKKDLSGLAEEMTAESVVVGERQEKISTALKKNSASLEAMQTSVGNGASGIAGIILQSQRFQASVFQKATHQLVDQENALRAFDRGEEERRKRRTVTLVKERTRLEDVQTGVKKFKEEMVEVLPLLEKRGEQIVQLNASTARTGAALRKNHFVLARARVEAQFALRNKGGLSKEDSETPRVLKELEALLEQDEIL